MGNIPLYYRPYFIYLLINGYWNSFYFLDIVNSVVMNIDIDMQILPLHKQIQGFGHARQMPYHWIMSSALETSLQVSDSTPLNINPEVDLMWYMVIFYF